MNKCCINKAHDGICCADCIFNSVNSIRTVSPVVCEKLVYHKKINTVTKKHKNTQINSSCLNIAHLGPCNNPNCGMKECY